MENRPARLNKVGSEFGVLPDENSKGMSTRKLKNWLYGFTGKKKKWDRSDPRERRIIELGKTIKDYEVRVQVLNERLSSTARWLRQAEGVISALLGRHYKNMRLPPEELRLNIGTTGSAANFWAQGINSSARVLEVFGKQPTKPILDWGCGSGRTVVWLRCYPDYERFYHGCDVDAAAVEFLRQNGVVNVEVCSDNPPLPYPQATFGGLFAFSVLTHIHPEKHRNWYRELRRVLEPGGLAYLTTLGRSKLPVLPQYFRDCVMKTGWAFMEQSGHYKSAAVVSEAYTRAALRDLFYIEYYKEKGYQDMDAFLIRRID